MAEGNIGGVELAPNFYDLTKSEDENTETIGWTMRCRTCNKNSLGNGSFISRGINSESYPTCESGLRASRAYEYLTIHGLSSKTVTTP